MTMLFLAASLFGGFPPEYAAVIAIIVAVTGILLISNRRKIMHSGNTPRSYARELQRRVNDEKGAVSDMREAMIELENLSRHIHGQIDTRYAKLEKVIRDADQRIDKLSRVVREASGGPALDVTVDDAMKESSAPTRVVIPDGPHAEILRLADAAMSPMQIADETGKTVGEVELILALDKTRNAAPIAG